MPEWLVERGIGETRAALIHNQEIVEGRIELQGTVPAGSVLAARLVSIGSGGRNALAVAEGGIEYLLPRGASGITQGQTIAIEVTREPIPGDEPWKLPLAKLTAEAPRALPPLDVRLGAGLLAFPAPADALAELGWNELIDEARAGVVTFAGGELRISPTPAMTLIDVDGYLAPEELAVVGAAQAARAIRRLDIGGSIGIDLPTCGSRVARQAAAAALDEHLPQPFERTAVNGFGFVQIVRARSRASLVQLAQDTVGFEARALLRRAAFAPAGGKRLVGHPSVIAVIENRPEWPAELGRQLGGSVSLRADPALPMSGGYAESL